VEKQHVAEYIAAMHRQMYLITKIASLQPY